MRWKWRENIKNKYHKRAKHGEIPSTGATGGNRRRNRGGWKLNIKTVENSDEKQKEGNINIWFFFPYTNFLSHSSTFKEFAVCRI